MESYEYSQNRELSWLKFNERVLDEASDESVPLFERLKFISIFGSNLDEFYMIRVGGLAHSMDLRESIIDNKTGWTPKQQLDAIYKKSEDLYKKRDKIYRNLREQFFMEGVAFSSYKHLIKSEKTYIKDYFYHSILPLLSPQIIDLSHPLPHFPNKTINIILELKKGDKKHFGLIPIPARAKRLIFLRSGFKCLFVEHIVYEMASELFPGYSIEDKAIIRITRNADIHYDYDYFEEIDYRDSMKKLLKKRNNLMPVRLEVSASKSSSVVEFMQKQLSISSRQTFFVKTPLDMSYVFDLPTKFTKNQKEKFCYLAYQPQVSSELQGVRSLTRYVRQKDVLLHYPYESMDPFVSLIEEAANDKSVISIKMTIYRLANDAKIVEHLCTAANNGKDVIVVMELRARFDEQNNIDFSRELEDAGCKIFYGLEDYKVHSKICLITYQHKDKISFITQIGTGNYNEKTAKLYTDLSLITANQEIGIDGDMFFKNLLVSNIAGQYTHLLVAPTGLRETILLKIDEQIEIANEGKEARIIMKVNGLTDVSIIEKLEEASNAGVNITLIVRGVCCIVPGIKGHTENIQIRSIIGKYLEHHRIYIFGAEANMQMYISSADIMSRNLRKRVEIACPILDKNIQKQLWNIVETIISDNRKAWVLGDDKTYSKNKIQKEYDSQLIFEQIAIKQSHTNPSLKIAIKKLFKKKR